MKTRAGDNEEYFKNIVSNDDPGIQPEYAVEERLKYYFSIKQPGRKLYLNSFNGMFLWLFSLKSIGLKASLGSVLMAYFLLFGNIKNNNESFNYSDSSQIKTLVVDTNFTFKDTCWQMNTNN